MQSLFLRTKELFLGSDVVRKYSFKTVNTRDNCALFARANHQLAQNVSDTRDTSAHSHNNDCFECLSPHNISA